MAKKKKYIGVFESNHGNHSQIGSYEDIILQAESYDKIKIFEMKPVELKSKFKRPRLYVGYYSDYDYDEGYDVQYMHLRIFYPNGDVWYSRHDMAGFSRSCFVEWSGRKHPSIKTIEDALIVAKNYDESSYSYKFEFVCEL